MTAEIVLTLVILLTAVALFITERLRVDLVALLVLAALSLVGLVTPVEALSGFSNSAVVTVWAVFILSGGMSQTGVADIVGRQVLRLAGRGEVRLIVVIMLTAGLLSAFMNNVGVAALLLPVVLNIARQTGILPSRLLLPLSFGCLLGGLTTLIGTPPNILASDALRDAGLPSFSLFDFAPVGVVITLVGVAYMVLVGRRLLPARHPMEGLVERERPVLQPREWYGLEELLAVIVVPEESPLAGRTLAESRIGRTLDLTILGLERQGRPKRVARPDTILQGGDRLLAVGELARLQVLSHQPNLVIVDDQVAYERLLSGGIGLAELTVDEESPFGLQTIAQIDMRRRYGLNVLAIWRGDRPYRSDLQHWQLQVGDTLFLQGARDQLAEFEHLPGYRTADVQTAVAYQLQERLLVAQVPEHSYLVGQSLAESHLTVVFGLSVLGIGHGEETELMPGPDSVLAAGDVLLVQGRPEELEIVRALPDLQILRHLDTSKVELESETAGLGEAVLAPRTTLAGKSLRQIHFREKYGLSILAIWRGGQVYRSGLADMSLQFGDAFLLYGPQERLNYLAEEPDFLLVAGTEPQETGTGKAPLAVLIMAAVVISVLVGWLPIAVAAVTGAALMVLTGCLSMDEAYGQIDWRAVFLIAGMLPLGVAMEQSGAAGLLAEKMVALVGDLGWPALLAGLFILTSIASQFMPNPVVTVLMAPIALNTAAEQNLSPQSLMMVIAIAASASFMSPVGHPANILVMGPGGYRFSDYLKVGIPLTILVLIVTLLVLPIFWSPIL